MLLLFLVLGVVGGLIIIIGLFKLGKSAFPRRKREDESISSIEEQKIKGLRWILTGAGILLISMVIRVYLG